MAYFLRMGFLLLISLVILLGVHWGLRWQFYQRIAKQRNALVATPSSTNWQQTNTTAPALIQNFVVRSHSTSNSQPSQIRIHQEGEMRLSERGGWVPFRAVQD